LPVGPKKGVAHGLFYQFGGTSEKGLAEPGSPANWRCLSIEGLSDIAILHGEWHSAPFGHQHQRCIDVVDVWADVAGFSLPTHLQKSAK